MIAGSTEGQGQPRRSADRAATSVSLQNPPRWRLRQSRPSRVPAASTTAILRTPSASIAVRTSSTGSSGATGCPDVLAKGRAGSDSAASVGTSPRTAVPSRRPASTSSSMCTWSSAKASRSSPTVSEGPCTLGTLTMTSVTVAAASVLLTCSGYARRLPLRGRGGPVVVGPARPAQQERDAVAPRLGRGHVTGDVDQLVGGDHDRAVAVDVAGQSVDDLFGLGLERSEHLVPDDE